MNVEYYVHFLRPVVTSCQSSGQWANVKLTCCFAARLSEVQGLWGEHDERVPCDATVDTIPFGEIIGFETCFPGWYTIGTFNPVSPHYPVAKLKGIYC